MSHRIRSIVLALLGTCLVALAMAVAPAAAGAETAGDPFYANEEMGEALSVEVPAEGTAAALANGPVVALDPGHGGNDSGAVLKDGSGRPLLCEKDPNWKISTATKEWLEARGVTVLMTRGANENPSIYNRVQRAVSAGACVFVSQHNNETPSGTGAEIYIPYSCSYYPNVHDEGQALADVLGPKLGALVGRYRGTKVRTIDGDRSYDYESGDAADYYGVIRYARQAGMTGVLVEHAFVDNPHDAALLRDPEFCRKLGIADAEAIYERLNSLSSAYDYNRQNPWRDPFDTAAEGSVFRFLNKSTGEHLFTTDRNEARALKRQGWRFEQVEWVSPSSGQDIYRLYNRASHAHFYTADANEYRVLGEAGWKQEGVAFHGADARDAGAVAIWRLYNSQSPMGDHLFTTDAHERDVTRNLGWTDEGTAFYGLGSQSSGSASGPAESEPVEPTPSGTPIMGESATRREALKGYFASAMAQKGKTYPALYASKGAATPEAFVDVLWEQATSEGVRPDVLLAQVILETGWLQFGGDVQVGQCNFGGIGATGNGVPGNSFDDVAQGLLAQAQHLKAYASTAPLNRPCVDPRFGYVTRGCAPTVEGLDGHWAGAGYGAKIVGILNDFPKS